MAQSNSLLLSLNSNAAAGSISLNVLLNAAPRVAPAAIQWTLVYPTAGVASVSSVAGPAASAAGKTLTCVGNTCVLGGLSTLAVQSGVVAVVTLQLDNNGASSRVAFQLTNTAAASLAGDLILIGTADVPFAVLAQPDVFPPATVAGLGPTGSIAQTASGGGWDTTISLINTGSASADARAQFFDDIGNPLSNVLNIQQGSDLSGLVAPSTDQTLASTATLVIESTGPDSQPPQVGSAQLSTDGNLGGFVRFHYAPTEQEASFPLETRKANSYMLAFDNTNGIATGVAVSNLTSAPATIPLVIRDDSGTLLETSSVSLQANGHSAFVLADQFAAASGQSGTIEFDTPAGGQISILGLRFPPGNRFSTIPVIASSDPGGGSMAHLVVGNGWTSTVELVNFGAAPAQAHLKFFGDDGSPLAIALTVSGTATTASAVDQMLAPYARVVIQSNGLDSDPLQEGAAQMTSDGNVSGFVRFRYGPRDQEAIVPIQSRSAGAYILVFDNTNSLATGVAVASGSGNAANIPVLIRDDTGAQIGSDSLALSSNGHMAFVLTDRFSQTANQKGTIEFDTPVGGLISVLGMRFSASGTFSTIPAVAP